MLKKRLSFWISNMLNTLLLRTGPSFHLNKCINAAGGVTCLLLIKHHNIRSSSSSKQHENGKCEAEREDANKNNTGNKDRENMSLNKSQVSQTNFVACNDSACVKKTKLSRMGRKPLSPSDRLQAMFTDSQENRNIGENMESREISRKQLSDGQNDSASDSIEHNEFLNRRLGSRAKIKPLQRLSTMIPQDYWDSLKDSETKDIVKDLGESIDTFKKK